MDKSERLLYFKGIYAIFPMNLQLGVGSGFSRSKITGSDQVRILTTAQIYPIYHEIKSGKDSSPADIESFPNIAGEG